MNLVTLHEVIQNSLARSGNSANCEQLCAPQAEHGAKFGPGQDRSAAPAPPFQLSDLAVRQGGSLTGQAKVEFEMMLACAIFDEPKCQNCISKGKRQNPGNC